MIRAWLFLSRFRIYGAIVASLLSLLLLAFLTNLFSNDPLCDCPGSTRTGLDILFLFSIVPALLGWILGWSFTGVPSAAVPGTNSYPRFLLTRPVSRTTVLLAPLLVCFVVLTLLPALMTAIVLGGLGLFRPAGIAHLHTIVNLFPGVRALGPRPSVFQTLLAIDFPRRCVAGISVGLCAYALMASQRWLVLNPSRKIQLLSIIPALSIAAPSLLQLMNARVVSAILLTPGHGQELSYLPSNLGILFHFAIAAAITLGCWRILRNAEI